MIRDLDDRRCCGSYHPEQHCDVREMFHGERVALEEKEENITLIYEVPAHQIQGISINESHLQGRDHFITASSGFF